jgi:hypothetical protein
MADAAIRDVLQTLATPMQYKEALPLFEREGYHTVADLMEPGQLWQKFRVPAEYPDYHVPACLMQKLINHVAELQQPSQAGGGGQDELFRIYQARRAEEDRAQDQKTIETDRAQEQKTIDLTNESPTMIPMNPTVPPSAATVTNAGNAAADARPKVNPDADKNSDEEEESHEEEASDKNPFYSASEREHDTANPPRPKESKKVQERKADLEKREESETPKAHDGKAAKSSDDDDDDAIKTRRYPLGKCVDTTARLLAGGRTGAPIHGGPGWETLPVQGAAKRQKAHQQSAAKSSGTADGQSK